ncbi:hypothetical protein PCANC_25027 [Puccinia coronata f. sp. avenae]|uniref:Uncharacterized protein n=1 Tax=Puccinia coronata f. sp. avenae TaxID=200324 RepID=A0A2N5TM99_9BASI|nr:hypothetical protein PCANC_25027 [Puccinia coronata f. sp. avenae]
MRRPEVWNHQPPITHVKGSQSWPVLSRANLERPQYEVQPQGKDVNRLYRPPGDNFSFMGPAQKESPLKWVPAVRRARRNTYRARTVQPSVAWFHSALSVIRSIGNISMGSCDYNHLEDLWCNLGGFPGAAAWAWDDFRVAATDHGMLPCVNQCRAELALPPRTQDLLAARVLAWKCILARLTLVANIWFPLHRLTATGHYRPVRL